MPYGDLARIRTNIGAMIASNALNYVNRELGVHQLRLATGKRLNKPGEGPAEFLIAKSLEATARRWGQAMANVQDTVNLFNMAGTGAVAIQDTLVRMSELCTKAASDLLSSGDRTNVQNELKALANEIDQTVNQTKYRGNVLLDGTYSGKQVWVGPSSATTDKLSIAVTNKLTFQSLTGVAVSSIDVSTVSKATGLLTSIVGALTTVGNTVAEIGEYQARLNVKELRIGEHESDVWATYSRIMNADMAKEQLQVTRYTILQQAAVAGLAQANTAPSFVLGLLGGG
jgi:flagellin